MNILVRESIRRLVVTTGTMGRSQAALCAGSTTAPWDHGIYRYTSSDTDFKPSEELAKERYDMRVNEDIEKKRARLLYQSRKRGMLENGVILASFADKYLSTLDADHLDQYDRLINLPTNDWDIYYWATKTKPTPPEFETPILAMLREHLNSKVSSEQEGKKMDRVLGKTRLDDIVMPAVKKYYDLDIVPSEIDLTNYKQQLFDSREKHFSSTVHIQLMTQWRKRMFERRLKRTLSSPTSIKILNRTDKSVYTQEAKRKEIASIMPEPKDMIDTEYDRAMKHHQFLQHLLSSDMTRDVQDYDDEAEAWAKMIWHRNYGTNDDKIAPSRELKCSRCLSRLHCCDSGLKGYVPKEIFVSIGINENLKPDNMMCQNCKFSSTYGASLSYEVNQKNYENFLRQLARDKSALIVLLVDLTEFPVGIWEGLVDLINGDDKLLLVVGNKLDLLPYDGSKLIERVNYALRKNLQRLRPGNRNLRITDTMVISARTGYGVEGLVSRILNQMDQNLRNVYLLGSNNSGKSTLFSALLQSDLCAKRTGDILSRVSSYDIPSSNASLLKFPIDLAEGWQVELKNRRTERTERNTAERIHALAALSERRQELMPHISTLINRLDYPLKVDSSSLTESSSESPHLMKNTRPRFTEDHPLVAVQDGEPLSAERDIFKQNAFFHQTPSPSHPDQLHDLLTRDERLEVFPNETIIPRKYVMRPYQTIFIAGLARLDLITSQSTVIFTIFASRYLPVHVIQTRKADKFYNQFLGTPYLGVPFGNEARLAAWPDLVSSETDYHIKNSGSLMGSADVVLSSVGWALVGLGKDQECLVRAYTPEGRGIFLRDPPLLVKASYHSTGKRVRDTPMYENPNYKLTSNQI